MNRNLLKFLLILLAIAFIVVLANITMRNLPVSDCKVKIEYRGCDELLEERDIAKMVQKKFGRVKGKKRKEVHCEMIEEYLVQQNLISMANVYLSLNGDLNFEITQSNPIVRISNSNGEQFYLDSDKFVCELKNGKAANVIVASGELTGRPKIKQQIDTTFIVYNEIFEIVNQINQDEILRNQIDQIYYSKKDKFQLIPKVGDYVILLGGTDSLKEKLKKLHHLYKDGFTKHGWDNYSLVNLTFDNQVVCTRK